MNYAYIVIVILLVVVNAFAVTKVYLLRHQCDCITEQLNKSIIANYDKQITIDLIDNKMNKMVVQINKNLVYQKNIKIEQEKKELEIRQSLANLAHDLRTPITALNGYIQLINDNLDDKKRVNNYTIICDKKMKELAAITNDFFELAIIEGEEKECSLSKINIANFLMDTILEYEGVLNKYKITPNIYLPDKSLWVMANEKMLARIIGNLISNTVKYAKEEFTVRLYEEENNVNMEFSNYVDSDMNFDINQLFNRTYKGNKTRNCSGSGLGLHIVQLLSEKQGAVVNAVLENRILSIILSYSREIKE